MKVTCTSNSALRLLMLPETPIERAFLLEMAAQSEKGATTTLALPLLDDEEYVLEVGGK